MKPFATFVCRNSFGEEFEARRATETSTLALIVGDILIAEGRRIRQDQAIKINAAFEDRLKEEMEKFRGREVRAIESEDVDAKDTQEESDFAYNRALRDAIHAIRALPLFETEEKP